MLFNSFGFCVFFAVMVLIYFRLPYNPRRYFLLASSYYFYMCWKPEYLILILVTTFIDYFAGIMMGRAVNKKQKRKFLVLSLSANLGLLCAFKYFNFFNDSLRELFTALNIFYDVPAFKLLLPVGISFYTFQSIGYAIDVYRGKKEPEKNLLIFALYVAFFPQLVAGPIERSTRLMPQFYGTADPDPNRISKGLRLMLWGLFKKVVIADRLAVLVDQVYSSPGEYAGWPLIVATYFFAFQIYCDFSGYSDIAIGSAKVLGFDLMRNFERPYFAKSITEFWKRWHIALSSWFRDYLYIPLGGNRVSEARRRFNVMAVFLLSGLWHGANWTFLIWGGLHGIYSLFSIVTARIRKNIAEATGLVRFPFVLKCFRVAVIFHLVIFAWIFFRASSLADAFYVVTHLFAMNDASRITSYSAGVERGDFVLSVALIVFLVTAQFLQRSGKLVKSMDNSAPVIRWTAYALIMLGIFFFGELHSKEFIYFQF